MNWGSNILYQAQKIVLPPLDWDTHGMDYNFSPRIIGYIDIEILSSFE